MEWIVGCTGKFAYLSFDKATKQITRMLRRKKNRKSDKRLLNVYRCRHCSSWHIGGTW